MGRRFSHLGKGELMKAHWDNRRRDELNTRDIPGNKMESILRFISYGE